MQPKKTGEKVAAGIRQRIACGELKVGDRLPTEEELTESFGIARTTLREALRILESQGLIAIRRGRGGGATVTMPDLARLAEPLAVILQMRNTSVVDLDEARSLMEPDLAARLATSHTAADLAIINAHVQNAADAAEAFDQRAFGLAAAQVHRLIIERAGNQTLSVLSELLHRLAIERYTVAAFRADQAILHRAARSYKKLADLITDGKADEAAEHWRRHLNWVMTESKDTRLDFFSEEA